MRMDDHLGALRERSGDPTLLARARELAAVATR
jgi:hypothetical protein